MARRKKNNMLFRVLYGILIILAVRGLVMMIRGNGIVSVLEEPESQNTEEISKDTSDLKPESAYTVLVNADNPLTEDYQVNIRKIEGTDKEFDINVRGALEAMINAADDAGYPIIVVSAYRTIEYQQGLFERKVKEYINKGYSEDDAYSEASQWVAVPGTSEHNTGLATDIVSRDYYNYYDDLEQDFENTETYKWLISHCMEYGFVLRYPKDKEAVTGIVYEPWHYRYVGNDVAEYMMKNNLCLEEYWRK